MMLRLKFCNAADSRTKCVPGINQVLKPYGVLILISGMYTGYSAVSVGGDASVLTSG
jgi:hypothetical protein